MSYQNKVGTLNPGAHCGGYNGQDAINDLLVTTSDRRVQGVRGSVCAQGERPQSANRLDRGGGNMNKVRRLTPLECERLQGFPDNWTLIGEPEEVEVKDYHITFDEDGNEIGKEEIGSHTEIEYFYTDDNGKKRKCSDSARYKALGNSIAVPFWFYLLRRISAQYERPATLGSLFDGISGFCLCWEKCNGIGTALWTSEIEEFPIAVAKKHFGDEETGEAGDVKDYL